MKEEIEKRIEVLEHELKDLKRSIEISQYQKQQQSNTFGTQGEWCMACEAWRQYEFSDNHHCTGYKA